MKSPRRVVSRRAIVTHLPEVTRVILIHHNSVMVLTTSHTATRRVLAVLADAAVTGGNVTALLAVLVQLRNRGKTNKTNIAASVHRSSRRKHSFPSILHHRSGRCTPRRGAAIPRSWAAIHACGKPQNHAWCNPPSNACPSTITRSPPRPHTGSLDHRVRFVRIRGARSRRGRTLVGMFARREEAERTMRETRTRKRDELRRSDRCKTR